MTNDGYDEDVEACAFLPTEDDRRVQSDGSVISREGKIVTIDVRGLEPPQPLVDILQLIENSNDTETIKVIHDRDPVLLYPELEDRNWSWTEAPSPEGELHLLLTKNPDTKG